MPDLKFKFFRVNKRTFDFFKIRTLVRCEDICYCQQFFFTEVLNLLNSKTKKRTSNQSLKVLISVLV